MVPTVLTEKKCVSSSIFYHFCSFFAAIVDVIVQSGPGKKVTVPALKRTACYKAVYKRKRKKVKEGQSFKIPHQLTSAIFLRQTQKNHHNKPKATFPNITLNSSHPLLALKNQHNVDSKKRIPKPKSPYPTPNNV